MHRPSPSRRSPQAARSRAATLALGALLAAGLVIAAAPPAARADVGIAGDGGGAAAGGAADGGDGDFGIAPEATGNEGGDVLDGTSFAGQDKLTLPGVIFGGGALVLDRDGGSAQTFTQLGLRGEFAVWQLAVGLNFDLNLDDDFRIRHEDWDEPSDWPRWIDYVEVGQREELLYARLGRLYNGRLGHGTLLDHYQSAIDLDSPKTGLQAEVNFDHIGAQLITNDVMSWEVIGARAYLDPLTWWGFPLLRSTRTSVQAVVDRDAPSALIIDESGNVQLDSDDNIRHDTDPLVTLGFGIEVPVLEKPISLVPYADLNFLSGYGSGLHAGVEAGFTLPVLGGIGVVAQAEYRLMDNKYLPVYFDAHYEVDRYRYPERTSLETKREVLDRVLAQNGYMVRGGLKVPFVEVSAQLEGFVEDSELNRLVVGAELSGFPYARARVLLAKRDVRSLGDAFKLDDKTTLIVQLLIELNSYIYLDIGFERTFRVSDSSGAYEPHDVYAPSVMIGWFF